MISETTEIPKKAFYRLIAVTVLFVAFAVMFFCEAGLPLMMVWPLATLFLVGLGLLPWQMSAAMLFSACGDAMGVLNHFLPQMGFFMLAHIFMISYFLPRIRHSGRGSLFVTVTSLLVVLIISFALLVIVSPLQDKTIYVGSTLYCLVIAFMFWCSIMQSRRWDRWSLLIVSGAFLFLASDMVLAWNKFVSDIKGSSYFIMVPYYAGQLSLFWGTALARRDR